MLLVVILKNHLGPPSRIPPLSLYSDCTVIDVVDLDL